MCSRARDDYEVLRLSPGCTLTALKKRYREMAVILHPDKSMVSSHRLLFNQVYLKLATPNDQSCKESALGFACPIAGTC